MKKVEELAVEWAAQIWCRPENGKREMDKEFAYSIAEAVKPLLKHLEKVSTLEAQVLDLENAAKEYA